MWLYTWVCGSIKLAIKVSKCLFSNCVLISWWFSHKHLIDWHQSMKHTLQTTDIQDLLSQLSDKISLSSLPSVLWRLTCISCLVVSYCICQWRQPEGGGRVGEEWGWGVNSCSFFQWVTEDWLCLCFSTEGIRFCQGALSSWLPSLGIYSVPLFFRPLLLAWYCIFMSTQLWIVPLLTILNFSICADEASTVDYPQKQHCATSLLSGLWLRFPLVRMCLWVAVVSNLQRSKNFPGDSDVKESACNAGDLSTIPGSGRSPGEGNGNPLQYSFLENLMDGGAWQWMEEPGRLQ